MLRGATASIELTAPSVPAPLSPLRSPTIAPPLYSQPLFDKVRENIKRSAGIYHPPVAAVTVAYPKSSFKDVELDNGFGSLRVRVVCA